MKKRILPFAPQNATPLPPHAVNALWTTILDRGSAFQRPRAFQPPQVVALSVKPYGERELPPPVKAPRSIGSLYWGKPVLITRARPGKSWSPLRANGGDTTAASRRIRFGVEHEQTGSWEEQPSFSSLDQPHHYDQAPGGLLASAFGVFLTTSVILIATPAPIFMIINLEDCLLQPSACSCFLQCH